MRFVLATMLLLTLPGCALTMGTGAIDNAACVVWKPISWSVKDTDQTIAEAKTNNARRRGFCGE
jgi:hypothetical protein